MCIPARDARKGRRASVGEASRGTPAHKSAAEVARHAAGDIRREPGKPYEVFLLNTDEGFVLPAPIAHPVGAAWLRASATPAPMP